MRSFILALGLATLCLGAPAPRPKPILPKQVIPGVYLCKWETIHGAYHMTLHASGSYECGGRKGNWSWNKETREFRLSEYNIYDDTPIWCHWKVDLDNNLSGTALSTTDANAFKINLQYLNPPIAQGKP